MIAENRTDRLIEVRGGRRVGLSVYGAHDGLPVVALHGTPASRLMFSVADAAAKRLGLTLYCPERAGYGLSDAPPVTSRDAHLAQTTEMLVEVVDRLGLKTFSIVGISGGGPFAVSLASTMGERVRSLVLVSPMGPIAELAPACASQFSMKHRLLFDAPLKTRWLLNVGAHGLAALFHLAPRAFTKVFSWSLGRADNAVLSKVVAQASLIEMTREAVRTGVSGALADLDAFSRPWGVAYDEVCAPSSLWLGTEDRLVPVVSTRRLAELLPNCEVVEIEGEGHFWVYEKIENVLAEVVRLTN